MAILTPKWYYQINKYWTTFSFLWSLVISIAQHHRKTNNSSSITKCLKFFKLFWNNFAMQPVDLVFNETNYKLTISVTISVQYFTFFFVNNVILQEQLASYKVLCCLIHFCQIFLYKLQTLPMTLASFYAQFTMKHACKT